MKRVITIWLVAGVVISLAGNGFGGTYGGGSGTEGDPYQIWTAEQFDSIRCNQEDWDQHFLLMADIDISGYNGCGEYNIIGYSIGAYSEPFKGVFDGNGHTISGFEYYDSGGPIGLFGVVKGGEIKNLGLIDPNMVSPTQSQAGLLVGKLVGGEISNCYVGGGIVRGDNCVGGLCGQNGAYYGTGTIRNCYSTATVEGTSNVGGLCGWNYESTIRNCYATGSVSGNGYVGGLCGINGLGTIANCFWDIETGGPDNGLGTPLSTVEMKMTSTFFIWGVCGNEGIWTIDDGNDYPRLAWQNLPGEPLSLPIPSYGGGSGELNDPYLIYTAEHLNTIGLFPCYLDKHFLLCADIDLSGYDGRNGRPKFNLIGYFDWVDNKAFTGVFDGGGHTISNFTYDSNDIDNIGLFSSMSDDRAEIKNIGLIDVEINAGTGSNVGALVGSVQGEITNCYAAGSVTGAENVVGLIGYGGSAYYENLIINCYSTAAVEGVSKVGGLVGAKYAYGNIGNCYSTGSVSGSTYVGGLCGRYLQGTIINCFWDIETGGPDNGLGTPLSTVEMQMAETFIGWGKCGDGGAWTIDDGNDYPRLAWQNLPGVPIVGPDIGYGGGSGTEEDPYLIYTAKQLDLVGYCSLDRDKHFKLMADIDLSGYDGREGRPKFTIIGDGIPFTGVFDGDGHAISNFVYESSDRWNVGLFSFMDDAEAEIKNLVLIEPEVITERPETGGLVGNMNNGKITNCHVYGGVVDSGRVGGLVGKVDAGTIEGCSSSASVIGSVGGGLVGSNGGTIVDCFAAGTVSAEGTDMAGGLVGGNHGTITRCYSVNNSEGDGVSGYANIGGLVGSNHASLGIITKCYSKVSVAGTNNVGGLVGSNYSGATIANCYATGPVTGDNYIGGLCGKNFPYLLSGATITNCYSTGSVSGNTNVGGFCGENTDTITNCCWDIETSGQTTSSGGTGFPTEDMQKILTFTTPGWDFVGEDVSGTNDIWRMCEDGIHYPHLFFQYNVNGDFACPDGVGTDDLLSLGSNWLNSEELDTGFSYPCDPTFDGVTNLADYAVLAENWLSGN